MAHPVGGILWVEWTSSSLFFHSSSDYRSGNPDKEASILKAQHPNSNGGCGCPGPGMVDPRWGLSQL